MPVGEEKALLPWHLAHPSCWAGVWAEQGAGDSQVGQGKGDRTRETASDCAREGWDGCWGNSFLEGAGTGEPPSLGMSQPWGGGTGDRGRAGLAGLGVPENQCQFYVSGRAGTEQPRTGTDGRAVLLLIPTVCLLKYLQHLPELLALGCLWRKILKYKL